MENIEKNICKEMQELIFSDEILSEEKLTHINNCECCSKLLLQKQIILNDLAKFDLIEDKAAFCEGVFDRIKESKNKKGIAFKPSRYAATAAAAVLVFASLFVLHKNAPIVHNNNAIGQVKLENNVTVLEESSDFEVSRKTDGGSYSDYEYADKSSDEDTAGSISKELSEKETANENSRVMLKAVRPETKNETLTDSYDSLQEENALINSSAYDLSCEDEALLFSVAEPVDEFQKDNQNSKIDKKGASGGGGGAASRSESEAFEEVVCDESVDDKQEYLPFCDIVFFGDDDNIEYNLALLQQKLDELYGEMYFVDSGAFKNSGLDSSFFADKLCFMTQDEFFEFIKSSSTFVYEK